MHTLGDEQAMKVILVAGIFALLLVQPAYSQTTYTITVKTDASSYSGTQSATVSGSVTPAPGPNTAVTVKVINPAGSVVVAGYASVNPTTGAYQFGFVTGGSSAWRAGTYTVNATWGAYPPTIHGAATFTYALTTTTTSTSSTTTSSTTTTTSSSTTSTTTTTSSTSRSSSTTTTTTTPSSSTSTASSSTTSSSSSSSGGIPEFPFQPLIIVAFTAILVSLYFLARRNSGRQKMMTGIVRK